MVAKKIPAWKQEVERLSNMAGLNTPEQSSESAQK
jgi:hypothetical protein